MFSSKHNAVLSLRYVAKNLFINSQRNYKVVVAGAAGGIGQPLALLLKQNALVSCLSLYDLSPITPGVGVDLSHMDTVVKVTAHCGADKLADALQGAHVVVCTAGLARKPGMSRDDLFATNAGIVYNLASVMAKVAPQAILALITNPINSIVPIASQAVMKFGCYDPCRILGVTTLDVIRSATFISEIYAIDPSGICIPCIGGHAGATIIPVLSQCQPPLQHSDQSKIEALTKRIQEAGTEVVKAKAGGGSATLSMAYAAAHMVTSILKGLSGESNIVECAYVRSCITQASYFANPIRLGRCGVEHNYGYGCLSDYELKLLCNAVPVLQKNIAKGEEFASKQKKVVPTSIYEHDYDKLPIYVGEDDKMLPE